MSPLIRQFGEINKLIRPSRRGRLAIGSHVWAIDESQRVTHGDIQFTRANDSSNKAALGGRPRGFCESSPVCSLAGGLSIALVQEH